MSTFQGKTEKKLKKLQLQPKQIYTTKELSIRVDLALHLMETYLLGSSAFELYHPAEIDPFEPVQYFKFLGF